MKDVDFEQLDSGMFSDTMDKLGYKNQVITGFKRNHRGIKVLGRARTLSIEIIETDDENIAKGLTFIETIKKGEILLIKGSEKFAYFGELMTRLSIRQGVGGVVIDGLTRDTNYTQSSVVKLPIVAKGYSPVDIKGRGRVEETDNEIIIENVHINYNDLVFIDNEAICVIPNDIENMVIKLVHEKVKEEITIKKLIKNNISIIDLLKQTKEF